MLGDRRPIDNNEIALIVALLNFSFPLDARFEVQISKLSEIISGNDDDTILKIILNDDDGDEWRKLVFQENLSGFIEASGFDVDGGVVNAMLWITHGEIKELEFLRPDAQNVICKPAARTFTNFQKVI